MCVCVCVCGVVYIDMKRGLCNILLSSYMTVKQICCLQLSFSISETETIESCKNVTNTKVDFTA